MGKKSYIGFLLICLCLVGSAQDRADVENLLQKLYRQQQSATISYEDFYESLFQFYQNPLDVNTASPEELQSLYLLSNKQLSDLQTHIRNHGQLLSIYELQSIPSFDVETLKDLAPFVTVTSVEQTWRGLPAALDKPDQHYLMLRQSRDIEVAKGYKPDNSHRTPYAGDPNNLYLRYRFQKYKTYSVGLTAEKDAGEAFAFNKQQYGGDFLSFHAMIYLKGPFKKIILGDYQLQFGQGMVLSGGFFLGKGSETILATRRSSVGMRPFTSALETNFFRGAACTWQYKRWSATPFISHKTVDAMTAREDSLQDGLASLRYTGLHRTVSELQARQAIRETAIGSNAQYTSRNNRLLIGMNAFGIYYNVPIARSDGLYNRFTFQGQQNANASGYYSYFWQNISLFGEMAGSQQGGKGIIQGILIALGPRIDASFVYRRYDRDLHTPFGNSFGENYKNANEEGIYAGLKIKCSTKTELVGFYDTYQFPWLKHRVSAPSVGHDHMLGIKHKWNKKTVLFGQYRFETKEKDAETIVGDRHLAFFTRQNVTIQLDLLADKLFQFKSRIQGSQYETPFRKTYGFLVSQDLTYTSRRLDIGLRTALFDTDDFDNRQYMYEQDVLYGFTFPFFNGQGIRYYALLKLPLGRTCTFWIKYGRTNYFDRETVGSGTEQTQGSVRSEIRLQCLWTFK